MTREVMASPVDTALQLYRTNYTNYRATGNPAFKTAYENAQRWLDLHVANLKTQVDANSQTITAFVQDYSTANPDLVKLKDSMKSIQEKGPRLQDEYTRTRRAMVEDPGEPIPYVKLGLAVALIGAVGIASTF
jgi:endonuclease/exonuclease/phosphatase (EEP) superfamily protein YafD